MGRASYLSPQWDPSSHRRIAGTLVVALLLPAAATASLRGRLHAALAGFDGRGTAALAVDLETGKAVYAHNASSALLPASNEKLAVTYAALVALGPSFRMRTEVLGDGHLRDGVVWVGDLVLKGYGDPFLDDAGLAALARDLRAGGIRRVTGRLLADESYFDSRRGGPGWKPWFVTGESRPLSALGPDGARRDREGVPPGAPAGRRPRPGRHEARCAPAAGRSPSASRRRSRRSSTAWTSRATTTWRRWC